MEIESARELNPSGSLLQSVLEVVDNLRVKKFLVLLLLCWMPVQATLAAFEETHARHNHAAAYSSHANNESTNQHAVVHTDDKHAASHSDADCKTSHFCMAQLLFLQATRGTQLTSSSTAKFAFLDVARLERTSERPERPQWIASSH
jgi:hypothetical protein